MNKRIITTLTFLLASTSLFAQVGIGTVVPSAQLEIEGTNTGIPVLELNPQSAPAGSAMGQLAVIGDLLYMYDATRGKWLSVASTALQYGKNNTQGGGDNYIRFGGDTRDGNSGPKMPFDGTIVYVTTESSNSVTDTYVLSLDGATTGTSYTLVAGDFIKTDYNVDFNAGQTINIYTSGLNKNAQDPSVIVWVKWRQ